MDSKPTPDGLRDRLAADVGPEARCFEIIPTRSLFPGHLAVLEDSVVLYEEKGSSLSLEGRWFYEGANDVEVVESFKGRELRVDWEDGAARFEGLSAADAERLARIFRGERPQAAPASAEPEPPPAVEPVEAPAPVPAESIPPPAPRPEASPPEPEAAEPAAPSEAPKKTAKTKKKSTMKLWHVILIFTTITLQIPIFFGAVTCLSENDLKNELELNPAFRRHLGDVTSLESRTRAPDGQPDSSWFWYDVLGTESYGAVGTKGFGHQSGREYDELRLVLPSGEVVDLYETK